MSDIRYPVFIEQNNRNGNYRRVLGAGFVCACTHANGRTDGRTQYVYQKPLICAIPQSGREEQGGNSNKINTKMFLKFNYLSTRSGRTIAARAHHHYFITQHTQASMKYCIRWRRIGFLRFFFRPTTSIGYNDVPKEPEVRENTHFRISKA